MCPARCFLHQRYMHYYTAFTIAHCVSKGIYQYSHPIGLLREEKMALTASSSVLCVCAWQAEKSWGGSGYDQTASSDYLYRLSPGDPERYEPTGSNTWYQLANPTDWPSFGWGPDLNIGDNGPPGTNGHCSQGTTYRGSDNAACGGAFNWGQTDLETWRPL